MKGPIALAAAAALAACATAPATATPPPPSAGAMLKGPAGENLGEARFQQTPTGLVIDVEVRGLTPGWHGMHVHEKGDCSAKDFTSAGAHVGHAEHGFLTMSGGEAGDLPNIWVGADGMGKAQAYTTRLSLGPDSLWDADTAALVIHAARDDHYTQPIGGSGARVACGVVTH
ncbi:MAG TPA: superoxide dismutase family protein [Caulobacteraceae bacterium]